jgi:hypothetical protein
LLNTIFGSLSSGVAASTSSYESISTVTVGSGGSASIDFTSIPATYTHLQLRGIFRGSPAATYGGLRLRLGSSNTIDTATNYSTHNVYGDGSSAAIGAASNSNVIFTGSIPQASISASIFGVAVIDILDYANTNKYKTTRTLSGVDANGSGYSELMSGNWRSTNAVNTLSIFATSGNFVQYSQFALYGIKGS